MKVGWTIYRQGIEAKRQPVLATLADSINALEARAIARHVANVLRHPVELRATRGRYQTEFTPNPTLVHHGMIRGADWHLLTDPVGRPDAVPLPFADLYDVRNEAEARRIAQALATGMGVRMMLMDNRGRPARLQDHPMSDVPPLGRKTRRLKNPREGTARDFAVHAIRAALKRRSGKSWSVTVGRGTAWGWIHVDAPNARRTWRWRLKPGTPDYPENYVEFDSGQAGGHAGPAERAELARLLGLESLDSYQGVSIPGAHDYYDEYMDRAEGRTPERVGVPYWDNPRHEPSRVRERGTRVTAPTSPEQRIAALRQIVQEKQYAKIDGVMVDGFSASAILIIYDAINDANKAKYAALPVTKMAAIAFKMLNRQTPNPKGRVHVHGGTLAADGWVEMTRAQWAKVHRDYKGYAEDWTDFGQLHGAGTPSIMGSDERGTFLAPVRIMDAPHFGRRTPKHNPNPKGRKRELSVPEQHALKIARQTLRMRPEFIRIMGGPSVEKARETIYRLTGERPEANPRRRNPESGGWTISGTLTPIRAGAGLEPMPVSGALALTPAVLEAEPEPVSLEAEPAAAELPQIGPRAYQVGERVSVPYMGRASYFGRKVRRAREKGTVEGYSWRGGELMVHVRVQRGHRVEDHHFREDELRRLPGRRARGAAEHAVKLQARLERQSRGDSDKAQAMLDKALAEYEAAEARAHEIYPQAGVEPGREYLNLRGRMRRLAERIGVLQRIVAALGRGSEGYADPWVVANRRRRNPALYDALGNGIAVGSVLVGTGLSNAGRSYTVKAISGKRVRLEEHLTGRDFWTFARHYRVAVESNPLPRWADPRSVRTVTRGGTQIRVACERGHYHPRARGRVKCDVGMRAFEKLKLRDNPRPFHGAGELERGRHTYRMWHEFDAHRVTPTRGPERVIPKTLVKLGEVVRIDYSSDKFTGRRTGYTHKTKRPHPVLATDPDGRHVYLVGGKMKVTADGLVN